MPYLGIGFFLGVIVAGLLARPIRRWWRKGCDRCRLEDIGGVGWAATPHTCFPWRNPYKDSEGNIWEFGKKIGAGGK